jgi:type VI protein secretion system component VasK
MGVLFQALTLRLRASGEQAALNVIAYFTVFLLLIFAFAAFVYAAATALDRAYGPIVAASVLGGVSLLLALIVIAWLGMRRRRMRHRIRMSRAAQPDLTAGVAASVLPAMLRASPMGTLILVAAAGYLLQRSTQSGRK